MLPGALFWRFNLYPSSHIEIERSCNKTPLELNRIKLPSIAILLSTLQIFSIYGKSESLTLHNDNSNNGVIYGLLSGTFVELSVTCKKIQLITYPSNESTESNLEPADLYRR